MCCPGCKSESLRSIFYLFVRQLNILVDDTGAQFDKSGALKRWWNEATYELFRVRTQCIAAQFSEYNVPALDLHLNGNMTKGESIADMGGLRISYLVRVFAFAHTRKNARAHLCVTNNQKILSCCRRSSNATLKIRRTQANVCRASTLLQRKFFSSPMERFGAQMRRRKASSPIFSPIRTRRSRSESTALSPTSPRSPKRSIARSAVS